MQRYRNANGNLNSRSPGYHSNAGQTRSGRRHVEQSPSQVQNAQALSDKRSLRKPGFFKRFVNKKATKPTVITCNNLVYDPCNASGMYVNIKTGEKVLIE